MSWCEILSFLFMTLLTKYELDNVTLVNKHSKYTSRIWHTRKPFSKQNKAINHPSSYQPAGDNDWIWPCNSYISAMGHVITQTNPLEVYILQLPWSYKLKYWSMIMIGNPSYFDTDLSISLEPENLENPHQIIGTCSVNVPLYLWHGWRWIGWI